MISIDTDRIREWFKGFMVYISIAGLISFACFMLEESFQTVMFGSWAAKDARRWDIVLDAVDLNRKIIRTLKIVNYSIGWVNPLSFVSYRAYGQAGDYWIKAIESEVLAREPSLMENRKVYFRFKPDRIEKKSGYVLAHAGQITVIMSEVPEGWVDIIGKIVKQDGRLVVDQRKK